MNPHAAPRTVRQHRVRVVHAIDDGAMRSRRTHLEAERADDREVGLADGRVRMSLIARRIGTEDHAATWIPARDLFAHFGGVRDGQGECVEHMTLVDHALRDHRRHRVDVEVLPDVELAAVVFDGRVDVADGKVAVDEL